MSEPDVNTTATARRPLPERLAQSPMVFDGAMGTMIYEAGVFINACYDELNLTNAKLIGDIHRRYVEAGAELIETNTFGANRIKLGGFGLVEQVAQINAAGVALAREQAGDDVYVAGSVGPCTGPEDVMDPAEVESIRAAFAEQIAALVEAGADAIFLETFSNLDELQLAAAEARKAGAAVLASFMIYETGLTARQQTAGEVARALDADANIDVIGLNCGTGPVGMLDPLRETIGATDKPVVVMPNAGHPRTVGGRTLYMTSPEFFTEYAKRFIELGARGVGGCCGTTPAHIAEAARAVKGLSGVKQHIDIQAARRDEAEVDIVPLAGKSALGAKLAAGETVTSVELLPPRSCDLTKTLEKVRQIKDAGVDCINIPDGPRASARVSPMVAAIEIHRQVGIEPVLHYCCRDRNLIGMQSDLMGGYAAGLANWLLITGDPPKLGEYPDATGVFDIDAIGLTQLANNLNHGCDAAGKPIDPPTAMVLGVGANPVAVEMEREIERYDAKLDAGAEFAITQPVFDVEALLAFLDTVEAGRERTIPVIAGVWPLLSYKNAEFMNNEVPGVVVPQSILDRMATCKTKEAGRAMGVAIARETIAAIGDRVAGIQVSAPLGIVSLALDVLEAVKR